MCVCQKINFDETFCNAVRCILRQCRSILCAAILPLVATRSTAATTFQVRHYKMLLKQVYRTTVTSNSLHIELLCQILVMIFCCAWASFNCLLRLATLVTSILKPLQGISSGKNMTSGLIQYLKLYFSQTILQTQKMQNNK